jgi:hypothetical protein
MILTVYLRFLHLKPGTRLNIIQLILRSVVTLRPIDGPDLVQHHQRTPFRP